jgi:hypothetical protein
VAGQIQALQGVTAAALVVEHQFRQAVLVDRERLEKAIRAVMGLIVKMYLTQAAAVERRLLVGIKLVARDKQTLLQAHP